MNRRAVLAAFVIASILATPAGAAGGWSADAATNLAIADRSGDQVQVKLAPTSDGGFYVSWYDNAAGGYDVALQRIDADGVEAWSHNGIIVADTAFEWTTDYGLAVDADDEALLAFRDDRGEGERITVARVAPNGTLLTGTTGLIVDESADFLGPPDIVSTSDDQIVVAWTHGNDIRVRRLDLTGASVWGSDVVFVDPTGATQMLADLQPTPDGGVIVSWVHTDSFYAPRHLWAQRLTRDGAPLWGVADPAGGSRKPLVIFDGGTLQYGNFPAFIADAYNGAIFAWYETDPVLQVRVQHVRGDGTFRFAANGTLTTEADASVERVEPALAHDPISDDIFVFWREMYESGPLDQWLRGQRFGEDGTRLWGPAGIEVEGHGAHEITQLDAAACADGVLVAYAEKLAEGDQRIWLRKLALDGQPAWPGGRVAVSTVPSAKSRLELQTSIRAVAALGWQDTRSGNEDIFLQNVNEDGTLGPAGPVQSKAIFLPFAGRDRSAGVAAGSWHGGG